MRMVSDCNNHSFLSRKSASVSVACVRGYDVKARAMSVCLRRLANALRRG